MYRENPEGTKMIVGSMNMGLDVYLSDTARNRTHNLLCLKCAPIPLGRRLGPVWVCENALSKNCYYFNCKTLQEATRLQEKLD